MSKSFRNLKPLITNKVKYVFSKKTRAITRVFFSVYFHLATIQPAVRYSPRIVFCVPGCDILLAKPKSLFETGLKNNCYQDSRHCRPPLQYSELLVLSSSWAFSIRSCCRYCIGDFPVACLKRRFSERILMPNFSETISSVISS